MEEARTDAAEDSEEPDMKCVSCGMAIKGKPIREEIEGQVYYYCCRDCFEEELCRRDKALRKAFRSRRRDIGGTHARHSES